MDNVCDQLDAQDHADVVSTHAFMGSGSKLADVVALGMNDTSTTGDGDMNSLEGIGVFL